MRKNIYKFFMLVTIVMLIFSNDRSIFSFFLGGGFFLSYEWLNGCNANKNELANNYFPLLISAIALGILAFSHIPLVVFLIYSVSVLIGGFIILIYNNKESA